MSGGPARLEFRVWGDAADLETSLADRGEPTGSTTRRDRYVVTRAEGLNVKMREGRIETKRLIGTEDGFERWTPDIEEAFPVDRDVLERVFDETGVDLDALPPAGATVDELIRSLEEAGVPTVVAAKRRHAFDLPDDIAGEMTDVVLGEVATRTAVIEGPELDPLVELRTELGLDELPNVSMAEAAARVADGDTGWLDAE
ncbi:MAG: hypothetical protein R3290_02140 [Acidimicrobiia bacterium]|nr:hypothetical protein [Acidimicrobiia bacterium]